MKPFFVVLAVLAVLWVLVSGCSKENKDDNMDAGTDTDTDSDTDTDADTDSDSDMDTDTDTDTDSDTDADGSTDTDADTDSDAGPTPLPPGCEMIGPSNDNIYGWAGWHSIDADHMVWRYFDHDADPWESVLMVRTLSTGEDIEVQRTSSLDHRFNGPAIWGNKIVFEDPLDWSDPECTAEIFSIDLGETEPTQHTFNDQSDVEAMSGSDYVVFHYSWDPPGPDGYDSGFKYVDLSDNSEHYIQQNLDSGLFVVAFDGVRWVVYEHENHLYKFDLQNTSAGPQIMSSTEMGFMWIAFNADTGELVTGTNIPDVTDNFSLDVWNMESNVREVIIDNAYSQGMPDSSGHIIAYVDSEAAGESWFADNRGQVKIIDRETKVVRTITPLVGRYYSIGIWDHWLAFNPTSYWGDVIVLCDLEAGGFIDTDGHVCPESGCPESDAGVDGGK